MTIVAASGRGTLQLHYSNRPSAPNRRRHTLSLAGAAPGSAAGPRPIGHRLGHRRRRTRPRRSALPSPSGRGVGGEGQCVAAEVPFFFKQWGGVFKKRNGRSLEGRTWEEMPALGAASAVRCRWRWFLENARTLWPGLANHQHERSFRGQAPAEALVVWGLVWDGIAAGMSATGASRDDSGWRMKHCRNSLLNQFVRSSQFPQVGLVQFIQVGRCSVVDCLCHCQSDC